jgi:hypothetical protein
MNSSYDACDPGEPKICLKAVPKLRDAKRAIVSNARSVAAFSRMQRRAEVQRVPQLTVGYLQYHHWGIEATPGAHGDTRHRRCRSFLTSRR